MRLQIGLAPLVIVSALAVFPAASQAACTAPACPHVYENEVKQPEGKKVFELGWGKLNPKNATLGVTECKYVFAGYLENPVGGGAALGRVLAFSSFGCANASCLALGGKGITLTPEELPWKTEVIEPVAGEFRQKLGFKSTEKSKPPKEPGYVDLKWNCEGVNEEKWFGETDPRILDNGLSIGALPDEVEFAPGASGESALETEALGNIELEGRAKTQGFANQAFVEVHNP
jgi:hypothetical protein